LSTEEPIVDPPEEAIGVDDARPRLRLHHLLAMTAVFAVLMAIVGQGWNFDTPSFKAPSFLRGFYLVYNVAYQFVAAVAITAFGFGLAAYRRGRPFFNQPGHWILLDLSVLSLFTLPMMLVYRITGMTDSASFESEFGLIVAMLTGVYSIGLLFGRLALNIYIAVKKMPEGRWMAVFIAKAVAAVLAIITDFVVLGLAIRAARIDRREGVQRDGYHWCGFYLQLAVSTLTILSLVGTIAMFIAMFRNGP
jgi:hypothetical protein